MEGRGFLIADVKGEGGVKSQDKKLEPAVPNEQENNKQKKNEQVPANVNPGLCNAHLPPKPLATVSYL